ncbi:MAG: preprotein translocase subunit SecA [Candidatus Pacebacteria bacterium]|nr:preprotein translocase subunit SecA [Candidatus Paceibacterota bacterium]MDD2796623.1 preprotein translocase subunit SecA [Candidatus Paceibacterota bacterium]MDD3509972.1 preprotein translocase subunit SecA [Candidatus Paceibacterota bacterium]MDD3918573.1 preprotein translocase subunit SecA [Candidatus Paceibacterota bacterium]MDD4664886.1 preprotein translocase subunit SecA [Candidatus Paceibacterota bacterium]
MFNLTKIFGDANEKYIKKLNPLLDKIDSLEAEFSQLKDEDFPLKTQDFQERIKEKESLDDILPEAFALLREASKRVLNQRHYRVQLIGGIVLHQGKIAEMKTGEGKTLTATLPLYLNALSGKGAHLVTVNDYLARRDMVWMGQIFHFLGLSTSCLNHEQSFLYDPQFKKEEEEDKIRDALGGFKIVEDYLKPCTRKEAYLADITYTTNNELGFDYLKDNMVFSFKDKVQRDLNYVIVDEVDSVLIDESRTPLIISAPDTESSKWYLEFARIIPRLKKETDYEIDEKLRVATLTEAGINKVEEILGKGDIYNERGIKYLHFLEQALKANTLFFRDKDYVVKDGEIVIVDPSTGRLMPGRRWSAGLHQAIEAKERVLVKPESLTLASITFQNYFRMYAKLAGMTGTAITSAEEFDKVYKLDVIIVPTNKKMIRKDLKDKIFKTEKSKFEAVIIKIKEKHEQGQPILVGTTSIEKNEYLGKLLEREGIPHSILNAKNHEKEGEIIAQAGKKGGVTVATNMAGRGVDIILGGNPGSKEEKQAVLDLGGLYVIGTERHEARRIDNQLRGRAGRQGDPGTSEFYLSLQDDLVRIFGGDRIMTIMERFNIPDDMPIENNLISKSVESAQSKIEGMHFDSRKYTLEYDDVLNIQRTRIYKERDAILKKADDNTLRAFLLEKVQENKEAYLNKIKEVGEDNMKQIERIASLRIIDTMWQEHLENMESLRESVRIRAYGQRDPLIEYKKEGRIMFEDLMKDIDFKIIDSILKAQITIQPKEVIKQVLSLKKKVGRNEPCPCGSGKKYKNCCGG